MSQWEPNPPKSKSVDGVFLMIVWLAWVAAVAIMAWIYGGPLR